MTQFYKLDENHHLHFESDIKLNLIPLSIHTDLIINYTLDELKEGILIKYISKLSLESLGNLISELELLGLNKHINFIIKLLAVTDYFDI